MRAASGRAAQQGARALLGATVAGGATGIEGAAPRTNCSALQWRAGMHQGTHPANAPPAHPVTNPGHCNPSHCNTSHCAFFCAPSVHPVIAPQYCGSALYLGTASRHRPWPPHLTHCGPAATSAVSAAKLGTQFARLRLRTLRGRVSHPNLQHTRPRSEGCALHSLW